MKRLFLPLAGALVLLAVSMPAGANHSWNGFHWPRAQNPKTLNVVDSVVGGWESYLDLARADWDGSEVLALVDEQGPSDWKSRKRCVPMLGKIRVCNAEYGRNGWLGLAQVWLYSGTTHIGQATAKVNDSYFNLSAYNNANAKRHVICQEIGHDFGLGHYYAAPSCMDDDNGLFNADYVDPARHDYDMLDLIYGGHFDQSFTSSSRSSNGAKHSVAVARDGMFTRITFITWAR